MARLLSIALWAVIMVTFTACEGDMGTTPQPSGSAAFEQGSEGGGGGSGSEGGGGGSGSEGGGGGSGSEGGGGGEGGGVGEQPALCHIGSASGIIASIPMDMANGAISQTEALPCEGATFSQGLPGLNTGTLNAQSLGANTTGYNGRVASTAGLANLLINLPGHLVLAADVVRGSSGATCTTTNGNSHIEQLRVDGSLLDAESLSRARSGLALAGGRLTLFIDQQSVNQGTRTVNAIRLVGNGALSGLDIIVSQAVAGMRC